jgi:hypothetical protein
MEKNLKLAPGDSQSDVSNRQERSRPPRFLRKAHDQHAPAVIRGGAHQPWHVRITANNAVHHDDIGRLDFGASRDEVKDFALDAVEETCLLKQLRGGFFVGRRQFDAHCVLCPCAEKLELDRSDTTTNLKDRPALHHPVLQ